jgi:hypothetical protein
MKILTEGKATCRLRRMTPKKTGSGTDPRDYIKYILECWPCPNFGISVDRCVAVHSLLICIRWTLDLLPASRLASRANNYWAKYQIPSSQPGRWPSCVIVLCIKALGSVQWLRTRRSPPSRQYVIIILTWRRHVPPPLKFVDWNSLNIRLE